MRLIKLAIISLILLFLLITGISLFITSTVRISRAIKVNAGREEVIHILGDLSSWKNWYPGADSGQIIYKEQKPIAIKPDPKTTIQWRMKEITDSSVIYFLEGAGSKRVDNGWNLVREQGSLTVQWYMDFKLRWYPWEKFSSLLFEKQYGTQMEIGLGRLKRLVENN